MVKFIKWVMASCLGTILALFLMVAIIGIIASIAEKGSKVTTSGTFLTLDLNRAIPELTDNVEQQASFSLDQKKALGIHDMRRVLQKASKDANVKGLVLKSTMIGDIGQAKTSTLVKYLKEFKDSGKKIYAYGDYAGQSEYLMMSVADSVFLNPQGAIDMRGFSRMIPFYKDLFEKLGVEWNVFYVGDYKSATEPYLKTSMSEKAKLQTRQYLTDFQQIYFDTLEVNREIDRPRLLSAQDEYAIRYAEDALEYNLVDDLLYWEEFVDHLKNSAGISLDKKIKMEDITNYFVNSGMKSKKRGKDKVAVLFAEGVIEYQTEGPGNINEVDYHQAFNEIADKDDIKAVVLRVNSPGGNAFSSEQIWHRVERIKAAGIPVVASYGNYAASGGYYISCGADTIVSQPNTITGSIGVFGMFPDASQLLNEKLGVYFDTVKTSPYAVAASPFYKLEQNEKDVVQSSVERMYDLFLTRVADGRGMEKDAVHEVAQGRVWSGLDALDNGLVDVIGDLDDAIAIAAEMADIEDYGIRQYPTIEEDFVTQLITQMNAQASLIKVQPLSRVEKQVMDQYKMLKQVMQYQEPQYLMPYYVE
jgi:protease-4